VLRADGLPHQDGPRRRDPEGRHERDRIELHYAHKGS
jgi:hypothetical protein